jgi:hypothetical protein
MRCTSYDGIVNVLRLGSQGPCAGDNKRCVPCGGFSRIPRGLDEQVTPAESARARLRRSPTAHSVFPVSLPDGRTFPATAPPARRPHHQEAEARGSRRSRPADNCGYRRNRNHGSRASTHADIAHIHHLMPHLLQQHRPGTRQTGIHKETHGSGGSGRQRMMLFLLYQLPRTFQRGADVLDRQVVLPLHFLEAHSTRQATHDDGHRRPRAAYHGFAMADARVKEDSIIHASQNTRRVRHMQPRVRAVTHMGSVCCLMSSRGPPDRRLGGLATGRGEKCGLESHHARTRYDRRRQSRGNKGDSGLTQASTKWQGHAARGPNLDMMAYGLCSYSARHATQETTR